MFLGAEWVKDQSGSSSASDNHETREIDIASTISKVGMNLAFARIQISSVDSRDTICFGQHIKFMKKPPVRFRMLPLALAYYRYFEPSAPACEANRDDVYAALQRESPTKYRFTLKPIHASLGSPIHGGCQATLMEMCAKPYAKEELSAADVRLKSIQVEYLSTPRSKDVDIIIGDVLSKAGGQQIILRVQIASRSDVVSQGVLAFCSTHLLSKL